jgi:hypothetical protein
MDHETVYLSEYWLPYIESHKPAQLQKWSSADIESAAKNLLRCFQKYTGFSTYALQRPASGAAMEVDLENSMLILDPGMMIAHIDGFAVSPEWKLVADYFFDADLRIFALNEARKTKSPDIFEKIWKAAPSDWKELSSAIFYNAPQGQKAQFPSDLRAGIELVRQHWQFAALGEAVERFCSPGHVPHGYDCFANSLSELDIAKQAYPSFYELVCFILEEAKSHLESKGLAWVNDNSDLQQITSDWHETVFGTANDRQSWRSAQGSGARAIVYDFAAALATGSLILDQSLLKDGKSIIKDAFNYYISELELKSKNSRDSAEELRQVLMVRSYIDDFVTIDAQDKATVRKLNQKSDTLRGLLQQLSPDSMSADQELSEVLDLQDKYRCRAHRVIRLKEKALNKVGLPAPVFRRDCE